MSYKKKIAIIIAAFLAFPFMVGAQSLTKYVNPFVGTGAHGHTYPGAIVPFGGVQLSPDTRLRGWDGCGIYHYSDKIVYGFSHTHISGTGVPDGDGVVEFLAHIDHLVGSAVGGLLDGDEGVRSELNV